MSLDAARTSIAKLRKIADSIVAFDDALKAAASIDLATRPPAVPGPIIEGQTHVKGSSHRARDTVFERSAG